MHIISIRESPEFLDKAIAYFQKQWASGDSMMVYDDCLRHCVRAEAPLPSGICWRTGTQSLAVPGWSQTTLSAGWICIPGSVPCISNRSIGAAPMGRA